MSETICEEKVREQLKQVIDPELFVNIVDLGLVYTVNLQPNAEDAAKTDIGIEMTMTSPMCPAGPQLVANSRQVLEARTLADALGGGEQGGDAGREVRRVG